MADLLKNFHLRRHEALALSAFALFAISFIFYQVAFGAAGASWTQATAAAPWAARYNHTLVVFNNKMWAIGGCDDVSYFRDVWYSTDGINWTQATPNAGWPIRCGHSSVVFDNKIWVIGGGGSLALKNDVWYSTDGINWTQATAAAPWAGRSGHTSVVFDNKIWVIGGATINDSTFAFSHYNDVWYSTDGINWTQATAAAPWAVREGHTSVVFDNKIWVIGGASFDSSYNVIPYKDVWSSVDGVVWSQITSTAPWAARFYAGSVVYDFKMWFTGGYTGSWVGDVWYSPSDIF